MTPAAIEPVGWSVIVTMAIVLVIETTAAIIVGILAWKWFWVAVSTVKPVHVDGVLYVCIAVFVFLQGWVSSDDAYKYVNPYAIFYSKGFCGMVGAAAGALKMFRSTSYSDSLKKPTDTPDPK